MIQLRPMSAAEYAAYLQRLIPVYAKEGARATGMPEKEALEFAGNQIAALLPDGHRTPSHHFHTVVDDSGNSVGILWFAERPERETPDVFIYDIVIDEAHRSRGLGSATMRTLEEEATRLGVKAISLHVFATNEGASRLYERLGYESTRSAESGLQMTRRL